MAAEMMQLALSTSTTIVVSVVAVLLIAVIILLLVRANAAKRERETRMRARLIEMEREAQFTAAADRVAQARTASEIATHLSALFREYLSLQVLAVYAGREDDQRLSNLTGNAPSQETSAKALPHFIPASLIAQQRRARIVTRSVLAGADSQNIEQPAPETSLPGVEASPATEVEPDSSVEREGAAETKRAVEPESVVDLERAGEEQGRPVQPVVAAPTARAEEVLLLPWRGPFGWNGLIVTTLAGDMTVDSFEAYREPIARLTERLGVALELESGDAAVSRIEQRISRATDFSRSLISSLDESSPMNAIVKEVRKLVDADSAALWRVDDATQMVTIEAADGLKSAEFLPLPLGQGLAGFVAKSGDTLAIQDAPSDPRCIFPREARESGILSYLGAPLIAEGNTFGVIEVHSAADRLWSSDDRQGLESAATLIAELIRTSDSRRNRLRIESAYLGLSEALQRLRSADEVKEAVVEVLGHALGASRVLVVEFNAEGQTDPVTQEHRQPSVKSALGARFGGPLVSRMTADSAKGPIAVTDSTRQSLMAPEQAADLGVLSELALPIRIEGKTRGVVYVHQCDRAREWQNEETEFAERVARQLSLSLANLSALEIAFNDASKARAELAQISEGGSSDRVRELEQKVQSLERVLEHSRSIEGQARGLLAKASALEAKARTEVEVARRSENDLRQQVQDIDEDRKRMQNSAQQLLEINRLKSEFIVNAGREIEASLQSVLGVAELLERGSYGALSPEQREAVHGLYGWARRIKSDVDWLIEYGSTRSRRLEPIEKADGESGS